MINLKIAASLDTVARDYKTIRLQHRLQPHDVEASFKWVFSQNHKHLASNTDGRCKHEIAAEGDDHALQGPGHGRTWEFCVNFLSGSGNAFPHVEVTELT